MGKEHILLKDQKRLELTLAMDFILANLYKHGKLCGTSWAELNEKYVNSQVTPQISNASFIKAIKALKKMKFIYDTSHKEYHGIGETDVEKSIVLLEDGKYTAEDRYYWYYLREYYSSRRRGDE